MAEERGSEGGSERGFFSRWSQRKVAVAKGKVLAEPVVVPVVASVSAPVVVSQPALQTQPEQQLQQQPQPVPALAVEPPPLTLDDVTRLTADSDFAPFMNQGVAPEVKNAAMKKLFTDPHYNVMDRLDIYIDDYSQPDPLPESMLRQMASAKFLKLFQEDVENESSSDLAEVRIAAASPVTSDDFQTQPPSDAVAALPTSLTPTEPSDDDPHLRLQPDHVPQPQSAGGGAA